MHQALKEITDCIGKAHLLHRREDKLPYLVEGRGQWQGAACAIAFPASTDEAISIIKIAKRYGFHIIPQGGRTGLVGGQIGFDEEHALIINMRRMNKIRLLDEQNNLMVAEAGCVLSDIHQSANKIKRQFPLHLASQGSAQLGGLLATNAGGNHVLRHGMIRDLTLGLEAVLADGALWNGLSLLRKDNSGYDLKHLLIGSEGTLALLTAAVLKLVPQDQAISTAMVMLESIEEAVALFQHIQDQMPDALIAFELLPKLGIEFMLRHYEKARNPFAISVDRLSDWFVLIDSTDRVNIHNVLEKISAGQNTVIAQSQQQADALWFLRENLSDVQKQEGASIKHDISVPLSHWAEFTSEALAGIARVIPDIRPVIFGHLGDGNLHFNLSRPDKMADQDFLAQTAVINKIIYDLVLRYHGSISAEHGIGILKRETLLQQKGETALAMMKKIKQALDPDNRFNPGKIFL